MFKNYIFDFGQVIVHFDPFYMTKQYISDEDDIDLVQSVVFDRIYWDKLDEGTITDEEVMASVCERLPERLHDDAVRVYKNWYLNLPLFDGIEEHLKNLKANGKKLYLLSNISKGFAENYNKNPVISRVLDMFDGLVFSGKIGLIKPDKAIFEYALQRFGLDKKETVFIDDNQKNISGAISAGIEAVWFTGDVKDLQKITDI